MDREPQSVLAPGDRKEAVMLFSECPDNHKRLVRRVDHPWSSIYLHKLSNK